MGGGGEYREAIGPSGPALGGPAALDPGGESRTVVGVVGRTEEFVIHERPKIDTPTSVMAAAMSTMFGADSLPRRVLRHLRSTPEAGPHVKVGGKTREKARRRGGEDWEAFKAADRKHRKLR